MLRMCYVMCIADLFHEFCGGQNLFAMALIDGLDIGVLFGVFGVWPCIQWNGRFSGQGHHAVCIQ